MQSDVLLTFRHTAAHTPPVLVFGPPRFATPNAADLNAFGVGDASLDTQRTRVRTEISDRTRVSVMETAEGGSTPDAPAPTSAQVREATRAVLPLVDLETVREIDVVKMVEQRLGAMVEESPELRAVVQDEIDKQLLRDDGDDDITGDDITGTAPEKPKAKPKRKRGDNMGGFVVSDDDDGDCASDREEEENDDDETGAKKNGKWTKKEWQEARHDWSVPAAVPPVVQVGDPNGTAPGAPPPIAGVDDRKIFVALSLTGSGQTAKSLASFLKTSKSEVNKALYRLQAGGKVAKSDSAGGAPTWSAVEGAAPGGSGGPSFGAGTPSTVPAGVGAAGPTTAPVAAPTTAPTTAAPTTDDAFAVDGQICALSKSKRVVVGEYRGKKNLSLREYYEKDGKWLPGKKGISLARDQWAVLKKHVGAGDVEARLKKDPGGAGDFLVGNLSPTRRLTVGSFRNVPTVGVREYYEKDGKTLPGFKGMNMSLEQWGVFCGFVDAIETAMGK